MRLTKSISLLLAALLCVASASRALADTFGSGANTFDIEFVTIGNPGNAADTTGDPNPAGSVANAYRIGKYEVSRDVVTKANSAGGLGITLNDMTLYGGNGLNRPATGVTWNEAARFVNWLNTSQGFTPAYKFTTQPGDGGCVANQNILLWVSGDAGFNAANPFRNSQAQYFLPSVDEWYKSAYYDPSANGGAGAYWNYPTGSDSAPTALPSGMAAGTAVYGQSIVTGPADITQAGGLSPYGTMAQGGNIWEWEETERDLVNDSSSSNRGIRGGSWALISSSLSSISRNSDSTTAGGSLGVGFRVASSAIPEPSTLLLGAVASVGLLLRRRR
jgi:formylglycine-generating enzyme required for sulfatase activity